MRQVTYTTIIVKNVFESDSIEQTKKLARSKARQYKKILPDSIIEDIEVQNGLILTSIK